MEGVEAVPVARGGEEDQRDDLALERDVDRARAPVEPPS